MDSIYCPLGTDVLVVITSPLDNAVANKLRTLGYEVMEVPRDEVATLECASWPKTLVGSARALLMRGDDGDSLLQKLRNRGCDSLAVLINDDKLKIEHLDAESLFIFAATPSYNRGVVAQLVDRAVRVVNHSREQYNMVRQIFSSSTAFRYREQEAARNRQPTRFIQKGVYA